MNEIELCPKCGEKMTCVSDLVDSVQRKHERVWKCTNCKYVRGVLDFGL